MNITEVRIKLVQDKKPLLAFVSIVFDDMFVVHDLRIINGTKGLFVSMPTRDLQDHCPRCNANNHLRANYCNHCAKRMENNRVNFSNKDGRPELYADIAHPINANCRKLIKDTILEAYYKEKERSQKPDYAPSHNDYKIDIAKDLVS